MIQIFPIATFDNRNELTVEIDIEYIIPQETNTTSFFYLC